MRATFGRAVRAELRKYLTTRQWWGMGLVVVVVAAIGAGGLGAAFVYAGEIPVGERTVQLRDLLSELQLARLIYTIGAQFGFVLTLVIGILMIGQEYRHQTITSTALAVPRRGEIIGAKLVALAVIAVVNALVYVLVSVLVGGIVLSSAGLAVFPDPPELLRALALVGLVLTVWAYLGFAVGVLIRNQIAAILIAVGVAWIVEPVVTVALSFVEWGQSITPYLPASASTAALETFSGELAGFGGGPGGGGVDGGPDLVWWAATLVLLAYAVVTGLIGYLVTRRRDIG